MAEGDGAIYYVFKEQLMLGGIDLVNDTIKVGLVTAHTPNLDTHENWGDVSGDEIAASGYVAGGETLASASVTKGSTTKFDGTDVTWSSLASASPSDAIMYDDTPSGNFLMAQWDLATVSNGGDYTLQWHGDGIITLA